MDCVRLIVAPDGRWHLLSEVRLIVLDLAQWHEGCPWPEIAIMDDVDLETALQPYMERHPPVGTADDRSSSKHKHE
jgi:hypothetical protein